MLDFHFILECKASIDIRKDYLGKYYTQRPNVIKFKEIMSTQKEKMLKNLCMLNLKIYGDVCSPWFPYYYLLSIMSLCILYLWLVCSLLYICYYCTSFTNIGLREKNWKTELLIIISLFGLFAAYIGKKYYPKIATFYLSD